jgi:hypothetical protein
MGQKRQRHDLLGLINEPCQACSTILAGPAFVLKYTVPTWSKHIVIAYNLIIVDKYKASNLLLRQ